MKRFALSVVALGLLVPAATVIAAAPAHASNVIHIRLDPAQGWTWSGNLAIYQDMCETSQCAPTPAKDPSVIKAFTVGPGGGLQDLMDFTTATLQDYFFYINDSTLTSDGVTQKGSIQIRVHDPLLNTMRIDNSNSLQADGYLPLAANLAKFDTGYELKFYPTVDAPAADTVRSAANVLVGSSAGVSADSTRANLRAADSTAFGFLPKDGSDEPESDSALAVATHAKNDTVYTTLNPGRITAMAKRFVASPGDVINIHGYGPDKGVALARAEHVRDHLLAEITRLGGDPDAYPTFVVYAGDPSHKKNVHVTIHQHAASVSTVPDGETLRLGGDE